MAIVKLRKVTVLGPSSQQDQVLLDLQQLGCVHLIRISDHGEIASWQHPTRNQVHDALRYLEACPDHRPGATHLADYQPHVVAEQVLGIRQSRRELVVEREGLLQSIADLELWGEFQLPCEQDLSGNQLWFYRLRHRQVSALTELQSKWTRVSSDREFEYVVLVAPEEPAGMPAAPQDLGRRSLGELRQRLIDVDHQIETFDLERIRLTGWIPAMRSSLAEADDETSRAIAAEQVLRDEDLFALQGWVPEKTLSTLRDFAVRNGLALKIQRPSRDDQPPTLLKNPVAVAGAEGAVTFYMTPGYRAWDPTWIMYISFSLFFAMIMADAGYGLVLSVMLLVFYRQFGKTDTMRRFRYLALFMVSVTVVYGVVIGSYFGISPPPGSLLDRFVWKSGGSSIMNDREAMMLLSAGIGVVHLATANLIVAWQKLGSGRALSHVGWASFMVGGLLLAIAKLPEPAFVPWLALRLGSEADVLADSFWQTGSLMLAVGLGGVFLFSSDRPVFSTQVGDWLWRPLEGLMGLTNISKAFGDALSYLRLFALGLASAQLAITFNQLAADVSSVRGIGLLLGLLIFLAGHTLNLVLGVVGGVVHGLRLNCIEFFSWSLSDEGYPFQAFRKKADC
jgi:V/A-type H+/Na+-transporting ATPase subunit I